MSDNIKKINLSTPGRTLGAGDIKRKKVKLDKTLGQLENLQEGSKKYHRKMFKAEKTLDQLQSGKAGIQGFKMPYNMVKNNSAIKELTTEEALRVPEYLPPRRIVEPKIVDDTYARNIQRNIEKHDRQNAMIEADRAKELERQMLERELKNSMKQYVKPAYENIGKRRMEEEARQRMIDQAKQIGQNQSPDIDSSLQMVKRNSATPYKLPHQNNAAAKQIAPSIEAKNPFKINRKSKIEQAPDRPMADIQETYDDNIAYAQNLLNKGKLSKENYQSFVEEEDAMLRDWRVRKAKDAAPKQTVSSSGGDNRLDEFLKRIENKKIKNPEYADVEGPEYSKSYDFFITNRSPESDRVAIQMDSLNQAVMDQAANRQFDEMTKTRSYQQYLMNKYNID